MAAVAPEVRGATGQLGNGILSNQKNDGAGKALPLLTGTVEGAKGELGIVQFRAVGWSGEALRSTWPTGPEGVAIGGEQPSPFDLLIGIPVGSRVLIELPAQDGGDPAKESVAVVVDVLAQHGPAKESAK